MYVCVCIYAGALFQPRVLVAVVPLLQCSKLCMYVCVYVCVYTQAHYFNHAFWSQLYHYFSVVN
jgi:hypothetical protein